MRAFVAVSGFEEESGSKPSIMIQGRGGGALLVSFRRSYNRVNGFLNGKCQQRIECLAVPSTAGANGDGSPTAVTSCYADMDLRSNER